MFVKATCWWWRWRRRRRAKKRERKLMWTGKSLILWSLECEKSHKYRISLLATCCAQFHTVYKWNCSYIITIIVLWHVGERTHSYGIIKCKYVEQEVISHWIEYIAVFFFFCWTHVCVCCLLFAYACAGMMGVCCVSDVRCECAYVLWVWQCVTIIHFMLPKWVFVPICTSANTISLAKRWFAN